MHPLSILFLGACFVWFLMAKLHTIIYRKNPANAFKTLAATGVIAGIIIGVIGKNPVVVIAVIAIPMVLGPFLFYLIEKREGLREQESLKS